MRGTGAVAAMRRRTQRTRAGLLAAVAIGVALVGLVVDATDALRRLELVSADTRFSLRGDRPAPPDLALVLVDDRTFDVTEEQWPFPRDMHAKVIDRARRGGARTVAYDVQFTEASDDPDADGALFDAVARMHDRIVLATTEADQRTGETAVLGGSANLEDVGARAAHAALPADPGAVVRRVPHHVGKLESFAVAAVETATGRQVDPGNFDERGAWIHFHGPGGTLPSVSFVDALEGNVPKDFYRDKIVVVGASAPSLQDVKATTTSGDEVMPGPEIQAEAMSTLLRGFPLRDPPGWVAPLLIVVLAILPAALGMRLRPFRAMAAALVALLGFAAAAQVAFLEGLMLPVVVPGLGLVVAAVFTLAVLLVVEAFERERTRSVFARFVPEDVVNQVLQKTDDDLRLGGTMREATVLFSDLRGFTTYSESREPAAVIEVLNEYLEEMTDAIMDHGGTLISYMGDGIMAVFNAPLDQPDHRDRALATAREMLARLEAFNARLQARGREEHFRMGIGINTGPVMCGNVGSKRRLDYTTIGDTVNTASRLEGMTKGTPNAVLVADSTRAGLRDAHEDLVKVDALEVRGRSSRVLVWGLLHPDGHLRDSPPAPAAVHGS
jgi:adenylate cyclase